MPETPQERAARFRMVEGLARVYGEAMRAGLTLEQVEDQVRRTMPWLRLGKAVFDYVLAKGRDS